MRKFKVYLDTSVVSYLRQEDAPERTAETVKLWELFKQGNFEVYISSVTTREVRNCPEPKRSYLIGRLDEIELATLEISEDVKAIAEKIIEMKILPRKSFDDCLHIAVAVVNECDCIISWNFKHIVNVKTMRGIRTIASLEGFKPIEILTPQILLESEE